MAKPLSKRNRKVTLTALVAVGMAFVIGGVFWSLSPEEETYLPGEVIMGLTAGLARELPPDAPRVVFAEVTQGAGIAVRHFPGVRTSQLPEDMGSGAAWGDYDDDGWPDLYVVNMVGPLTLTADQVAASPASNRLYHNNGDGTFTDVSEEAGVDLRGWGMGAAWGDGDGDGDLDLFVSGYGENVYYRNDGNGTFTDQTRATGLGGLHGYWAGVAWGDYDRDGDLDLYVAGYVKYKRPEGQQESRQYDVASPVSINPSSFPPERNLLYRNDGGVFSETALPAGVANFEGRSLSATWVDLDEDGWLDLYIANDVSDNVLYHNMGDGTFEDLSHRALVADYRGAMGIAAGDWDGDADLDLFLTHWIAQENALYNNQRSESLKAGRRALLRFMDVADRVGLGQVALDYIGWGTSFFDYDNDGRLDLLVVNGSTFQEPEDPARLIPMKSRLFWNRGAEEGFFDVSAVSGDYFETPQVGRGAAWADYDRDGDEDVFIVNHGGMAVLLRNENGPAHAWLEVSLVGQARNRAALGARLRLVAGGNVQVRQVGAQGSYCSQNSFIQHFGLGLEERVDTLEVYWPSGARQVLVDIPARQILKVTEGEGGV